MPRVQIVGSVLVRDEDLFLERAICNVAAFCDRIHAVDHRSRDETWPILRRLTGDLDHLDVRRSSDAGESHRLLERYAGTRTWVLGVDGDELYDPTGLGRLRELLLAGELADVFNVKAHVLNCDELDEDAGQASGYLAPPSRPITKLFNLAAVESWSGCLERLHGGSARFRAGYDWETRRWLSDDHDWSDDPLRCLHVCFLRRSSLEPVRGWRERRNLDESREFRRGALHRIARRLRRPPVAPRIAELHRTGGSWKREAYMRGARVTVDARPFRVLPPAAPARGSVGPPPGAGA